jgi:branched-subunit amino acid transport protein
MTMSESHILLTIAMMSIATMVPRVLPFLLVGGRDLPRRLVIWLRYVPVAVLSAMLAPELLMRNQSLALDTSNLELCMALPTFAIAVLTRSLFATVLVGLGGLALARALL